MSHLVIPHDALATFCSRWKIRELALFGSAATGSLAEVSDVDLLVTFAPDAQWTILDHVEMQHELGEILGRRVDLITRPGIENSRNQLRRAAILSSARTIYAAA